MTDNTVNDSIDDTAHEARKEAANETTNDLSDDVAAHRLPAAGRWHDPLGLIRDNGPARSCRVVVWSIFLLIVILIIWAVVGKLDIIATASGKLVPQTLLKIVQPSEAGIVRRLEVNEGDHVKAGQVLVRLDATEASADQAGVASDLQQHRLQQRRIRAALAGQPMQAASDDDPQLFGQIQRQDQAHRKAFNDSLEQELALLQKAEHEQRSAAQIRDKLEQTLPTYQRAAEAYRQLEQQGFFSALAAADKQREAIERSRDLDAQRSVLAALDATIAAQQLRITQLHSTYRSDLERELADIRARIAQLQPSFDKSLYRTGLMELTAPQDGIIKDLATTTVGAVVQPGTVIMTLVPRDEQLYVDVHIRNEDIGFVQVGQKARIKLAAYPFQKYGMLEGTITRVSADATDTGAPPRSNGNGNDQSAATEHGSASYKARIELDRQTLIDPQRKRLPLAPGMHAVAEIHQGTRTVLAYLLSPMRKVAQEAGRER